MLGTGLPQVVALDGAQHDGSATKQIVGCSASNADSAWQHPGGVRAQSFWN